MFFDGEYRLIGTVDPSPLQRAVAALPEAAWFEETARQQVFPAHRHTQTVPLIFDPDMRHTAPSVRPAFTRLRPAIEPVMARIVAHFSAVSSDPGERGENAGPREEGYFVRILLARLAAGQSIGSHRDHGESLSRAHRIHCPIVTNPQAEFGIAGHIRHLPAGEIWEINNRKVHGVRNLGSEARVHLILDYVIPGETVEDPEGILVS